MYSNPPPVNPLVHRTAVYLGLAGLLPFIALGLCVPFMAPSWQTQAVQAVVAYGAVILSFLGGVHWGAVLIGQHDNPWRYGYAVMPSLLGWVAVLCENTGTALFLLSTGLLVTFFIDRAIYGRMHWFTLLRAVLTLVATTSLYLAYQSL